MRSWISHDDNERPVHPDQPVRVKWADGFVSEQVRKANWYDWRKRDTSNTICAYQLHPVIPESFVRWTGDGAPPEERPLTVYLREGYSYCLKASDQGRWEDTDGSHDIIAYKPLS